MSTGALPRNIRAHPTGYAVCVMRRKVCYRAYISFRHPDALQRAIAARDRFFRIAGEIPNFHQVAGRSNTGIAGISESVKWKRNRAVDCFIVNWELSGARHRTKRFLYGSFRPRAVAFNLACQFRERVTGIKIPIQLREAANVS